MLSDSDIVTKERYRNDAKLHKRCVVVITPSEEMLQYEERKQIQLYSEILQKQRKELELRALEKQREKERRRVGRREEKTDQTKLNVKKVPATVNDEAVRSSRRTRNDQESFMSSESEYEATFQVRMRRPKPSNSDDLEPLNIHIESTEATTTTLLNQIDAHLDEPSPAKHPTFEIKNHQKEKAAINNGGNQQICDINSDRSQTKMIELNLLADIAQNLSPYQLELPKNNSSRSPSPAPELSSASNVTTHAAILHEEPKHKVIVTEQLFIQPIDNLLENRTSPLDNNFQQEQALPSYAHEPKLNIATTINSSPCANFMQKEKQQTDSQPENENNDNHIKKPILKISTDDALEQILEESISVLTVNTPLKPLNEQKVVRSDPAIPILISSVESLNQHDRNDMEREKSENKDKLHGKSSLKSDSKNLPIAQRKEKNKSTKDDVEHENVIKKATTELSMNVLNDIESSIMCASGIVSSPTVRNITPTLAVSPLTAADLSDISLESGISKHLPEIADPSPVVTDISDNSNESTDNSNKPSFEHQFSNNNNNNNSRTSTGINSEISVPDLSLVMPNLNQSSNKNQPDSFEPNFNQFNSNLNTPIKRSTDLSQETDLVKRSSTDLNTPLKFGMQPELESNTATLKSGLESDTDNNVTKFLDLILNKTVTDAEEKTREKIIKELNALTADAIATSEVMENTLSNNEIIESEFNLKNEKNLIDSQKHIETNKEIDLKEQNNLSTDTSKSDKTSEYSLCVRKEKISSGIETTEPNTFIDQHQLYTPSANNDLSPPKLNLLEDRRELLCDIKTTELTDSLPVTFLSSSAKTTPLAIKQTFNIKCRVRLKRLNMDDHSTITKIESMPAIITTNPIKLFNSNNDLPTCDPVKEKTPSTKKTCMKVSNKHISKEWDKPTEHGVIDTAITADLTPTKKPKLDSEKSLPADAIQTPISQKPEQPVATQISKQSDALASNTTVIAKPTKPKTSKTVTFDFSNLNEEPRDNATSNHKQKSRGHACYLKNSRTSGKLPDNTLRAAETLQLFVNTINARTRSPPPAEFNKKRSPIKNKCIAEDETPRPPPASSLMGTPPCKKSCTEKSRSHLTSKYKDHLVSSLTSSSIPSITSDITARIYTSSPLDQTLPEYDDNVDTVGDSELILPTTTGSLRRKLKRPKKSLSRPEPADDVCTDDIVNQPDNREDDTDAVVDNEDDDFAEELLPIPAANEHILEEIVSARPTHIGTSAVIRDEYMNIEATATVPVYLFNDESRDLGSPEVIQSSDYTNVVDSSSYLNTAAPTAPSNVVPTPASATSTMGNLEKSMLSPSEHEVSSTQETFYQTPAKNKQTEIFGEKSSTSKEKGNNSSALTANTTLKQKSEDNNLKNKEDYQTSSTVGLLQNNQVDTTNHSPEMCTLALTATTTNTPTLTNNRKIRKASTHDEILYNELQQQLPSTKRKSNNTTFCVESTSGNNNNPNKTKVVTNNLDDIKSNGSLAKVDDKFKKLLKEVCKIDKNQPTIALDMGLAMTGNNSGGGSSPSTTTTINEESLPRSKRKKLKSSKSKKSKNRTERTSKISLKPSKLTPHIPANPLIITIPKSRLPRPLLSLTEPIEPHVDQPECDIFNIPNAKLFIEKNTDTELRATAPAVQNTNQISLTKKELINSAPVAATKTNFPQNHKDNITELEKLKSIRIDEPHTQQQNIQKISSTPTTKENSSSSSQTTKKRKKIKINDDVNIFNKASSNSNNLVFAKDKYDLIKSKDKHHHHQHNQDNKEKSEEKTNSHSKSLNSNKGLAKEKVRGDKSKEKHKKGEKSTVKQPQPDNVLKITISHTTNKSFSTSSANLLSADQLFSSNIKQSNSKTSKLNSPSLSNAAALPISSILKSKVNHPSTTNFAATTIATTPTHTTTTTLSTNNVRKKYKMK